jgi:hypothetical protein
VASPAFWKYMKMVMSPSCSRSKQLGLLGQCFVKRGSAQLKRFLLPKCASFTVAQEIVSGRNLKKKKKTYTGSFRIKQI